VERGAAYLGDKRTITYRLIQLAPSVYDLLLHDTIVASVMQNGSCQPYTWTAELLEDLPRNEGPSPFREIEHDFASLAELCAWLGYPTVKTNNRQTAAWPV